MIESLAGVLGGFGLFAVGLSLLSENLKAIADRRLRAIAKRWMGNRLTAYGWGVLLGLVSQSVAASTFVTVGLLRSGLVGTVKALALLMGSYVGLTVLVLVATLDIEIVALYILGLTGITLFGSRAARVRRAARAIFGGALMILGLVLIRDAAAPLAQQPWFGDAVAWARGSLWLIFVVSAALTFIIQSTAVMCIIGVTLASVGVFGLDEAMTLVYGSVAGSGAIVCALSMNIRGRARQVAMYPVIYNTLLCLFFVPLLLLELHFGIPLVRALVLSVDLGIQHQITLVYALVCVGLAPLMLTVLGPVAKLLDRLWPATQAERIGRTRFIQDRAIEDLSTSVVLADLEQRRILSMFPRYFDAVRRNASMDELRKALSGLLSETQSFLAELSASGEAHAVEDRAALLARQSLLIWFEERLAALCAALRQFDDDTALRTVIVEGVDAVLICLIDAVETDDDELWDAVRVLTSERGAPMRKVRESYAGNGHAPGAGEASGSVIALTSAVEQVFLILGMLAQEFGKSSANAAGNGAERGREPEGENLSEHERVAQPDKSRESRGIEMEM